MLGTRDLFDTLCDLEHELTQPPDTFASVDRNRFTSEVHIDLLYAPGCPLGSIVRAYVSVRRWLTRQLEASALDSVRFLVPVSLRRNEDVVERQRTRALERALQRESPAIRSIFSSFLRYLLPEGKVADAAEVMPGTSLAESVLVRLRDSRDVAYDLITPELDKLINENPRGLPADRLAELKGLRWLVRASDAPFVVACLEKFLVRDEFGRTVDDWDGVVLEIRDDRITLTVLEAKNRGSKTQNENEAFQQLAATKRLLLSRHKFVAHRVRFRGIGAILRCVLLELPAPASAPSSQPVAPDGGQVTVLQPPAATPVADQAAVEPAASPPAADQAS